MRKRFGDCDGRQTKSCPASFLSDCANACLTSRDHEKRLKRILKDIIMLTDDRSIEVLRQLQDRLQDLCVPDLQDGSCTLGSPFHRILLNG